MVDTAPTPADVLGVASVRYSGAGLYGAVVTDALYRRRSMLKVIRAVRSSLKFPDLRLYEPHVYCTCMRKRIRHK